jgi:hypothetical protein
MFYELSRDLRVASSAVALVVAHWGRPLDQPDWPQIAAAEWAVTPSRASRIAAMLAQRHLAAAARLDRRRAGQHLRLVIRLTANPLAGRLKTQWAASQGCWHY